MLSTSRAQERKHFPKSAEGTSKGLSPSASPDCIVRIARTGSRSRTRPIAKPRVGTIFSGGSRRLEVADELARSIRRTENNFHRRLLGYGIALLKQQNELLKAEKSLKQTEPGLARDLERMIRTADRLAEEKRQL